jgi:hypothetical protein
MQPAAPGCVCSAPNLCTSGCTGIHHDRITRKILMSAR